MDTIFKKGDKVFHYHYGWGTIKKTSYDLVEDYPLTINFGKQGDFCFTNDGRELFCEKPSLSFTEYKLDGFSQERPENLPKLGEVVWVRDRDNEDWIVRHFLRKIEVKYLAIEDNPETYIFSEYDLWDKMTTENPYMK
jgi:hypothetical protein